MPQDPLFRPWQYKGLQLANRVVMAPMTRSKSPGGVPGPQVAAYYRRRAEAGVGLILTEGTTIDRPAASGDPAIPNFHAPASLEGWARVVEQVHQAGGRIAPQLWHQGMARQPGTGPHPEAASEGPSGLATTGEPTGLAMTEAAIAATVEAFAEAAAQAKAIGFDALELHGAHGYLIDQFFWAGSNHRSDAYGGDLLKRTRFGAEVIRAVRLRVGPEFPIIFRFSQWKLQDYEARLARTPEELAQFLQPLTEAGVDVFHCSTRRFWEPEFPGSPLNLAGWTKQLTGHPTITVGSVGLQGDDFIRGFRASPDTLAQVADLRELDRRLAADEFDLVAVGRALLQDPAWAAKIREGRTSELQPFSRQAFATLS
jgi:2,4-dienoyl-CoA reductase-like NADH-dependent reductase (Old Yellow Enzyme family)